MTESKNVRDWFRFIDMDLSIAEHSYKSMYPKPLEAICYHCQQAAEKYIKGVMMYFGQEVIKTHDLVRLHYILSNCCTFRQLCHFDTFSAKAENTQ